MTEKIDIKDLNKADVLAVLYNASKPQGAGFMHYDPTPMTREEAQKLIDDGHTYFDYFKGRVMKIDISGSELDPWCYDRDNGPGAARTAISALNSTGQVYSPEVKKAHVASTEKSIKDVTERLFDGNKTGKLGEFQIFELGLADMLPHLGPKVNEAVKKLDDLKKE